jgi:aminoglycoside phosphotransferase (APT) family kinase protein
VAVSGSDIAGRGASADVLAWGEGRVVKLFHPRYAYAVDMELERARAELARLPADAGLCHMDFHPGNVVEAPGRAVVVDRVNACSGPLALDVARSFVLLACQGAAKREGSRQRVRLALADAYRALMTRHVAGGEFDRGLAFAADALLRAEPSSPYTAELQAAIPWR